MNTKSDYSLQGFTIIEVMVAMAIGMVAIMGMLAMNSSSLKSQKYLSQKYAALDLGSLVRLNMLQPNFCSCNFPAALNFSSATIPVTTLNAVPSSACLPITEVLASSVASNNILPGSSGGLKIKSMQLQNIRRINAPSATSNLYSFEMQIDFDPASTAFAIRPLVIGGLAAKTTVVGPSAETISSCRPYSETESTPSLSIEQMCVALGGTFKAPLGPCTLPAAATNAPVPTTPSRPPGSLVGKCTLIGGGGAGGIVGSTENCTGGAAGPDRCPSGSVIFNYYHLKPQPNGSGAFTRFDCIAL